MTLETVLAEIVSWPVEQRIRLVQAVWDIIAADQAPGLTEDQKREIDRRVAELDARPDNVLTWEQIKARACRQAAKDVVQQGDESACQT